MSVALPAADAGAVAGAFSAVAAGLGNVQEILALHTGTLSSLGSQTIDGVPATGDRASYPVAKLLGAVPGIPAGLISKVVAAVGPTIPLSLWADAQGRVVQLGATDTATAPHGSTATSFTADFSGYDTPVSIVPPPSGQVKPIPASLLEMAGSFVPGLSAVHGSRTGHGDWTGHGHWTRGDGKTDGRPPWPGRSYGAHWGGQGTATGRAAA